MDPCPTEQTVNLRIPAESIPGEKEYRSRSPAPEAHAKRRTDTLESDPGRRLDLGMEARRCSAQMPGRLPAVKRPPESSLSPFPLGKRTPLPARQMSVLLSHAPGREGRPLTHHGRGDSRSPGPEGQAHSTSHAPTRFKQGGPPLTHKHSHLQNCGFQGSEKVPQLVSLKKFKDEPVLASLSLSGSETCTNLLRHMQARTRSCANSNPSPCRKPAPGNAGPWRGVGSLPPCGPGAARWCPAHPKASSQSGAAVAVAAWGPACVGPSLRAERSDRTRTSRADVAFPGVRPRPSAAPHRAAICSRGGRGRGHRCWWRR